MKKFLSLLTLISTMTFVQGQNKNLIITDSVFKAGIYNTFDEFKHNNPSIELKYEVTIKNRGVGARQVTFYRIAIDKQLGESIGYVYGFCDGKNVYVNEKLPRLGPKAEFSKIEYFGKYCYYKERAVATSNVGAPNQSSTRYVVEKVINIYSGEFITLSKSTLREIMADNPTILNEFNKASRKNKKLKEFLIKYMEYQ